MNISGSLICFNINPQNHNATDVIKRQTKYYNITQPIMFSGSGEITFMNAITTYI